MGWRWDEGKEEGGEWKDAEVLTGGWRENGDAEHRSITHLRGYPVQRALTIVSNDDVRTIRATNTNNTLHTSNHPTSKSTATHAVFAAVHVATVQTPSPGSYQ